MDEARRPFALETACWITVRLPFLGFQPGWATYACRSASATGPSAQHAPSPDGRHKTACCIAYKIRAKFVPDSRAS